MKTKLIATVLLSVVGLLLVLGGTTHAQPPDERRPIHQHIISSTVYLPIVAKPPCTPTKATAYIAVNKPVVRVGEILTATSAIVNECSLLVGIPYYAIHVEPPGILSPTVQGIVGYYAVPIGEYREVEIALLAVGTGPVTVTTRINYESVNEDYYPPPFYWVSVGSSPTVVRVLPAP